MRNVSEFGAVGDGHTDDAAAIQKAINETLAAGEPLEFDNKTYAIGHELSLRGPHCLIGAPEIGSTIGTCLRALTPMRSVLSIVAHRVEMRNITVDAHYHADHAILGQGMGMSELYRVRLEYALKDGIRFASKADDDSHANNDGVRAQASWFTYNGTLTCDRSLHDEYRNRHRVIPNLLHSEGTLVGTTDGGNTITVDGTDLSTLNLRIADFVRFGTTNTSDVIGIIESVEKQVITLQEPLGTEFKSSPMAIASGDCWREEKHNDNNILVADHCLFRGAAGVGMAMAGLYGDTALACQWDANIFYHVRVGESLQGGHTCISPAVITPYFEGGVCGKAAILARAAQQITVVCPMDRAYPDTNLVAGGSVHSYGVILGASRCATLGIPSVKYPSMLEIDPMFKRTWGDL